MAQQTAVAERQARLSKLSDLIEAKSAEFERALSGMVDTDAFKRTAITTIQNNANLLESTPASIVVSLLECAQLGLVPDTKLGQAWLIGRKNKKKGVTECSLQIGYRGYIVLAYRSEMVSSIHADVVYDSDFFEYEYGSQERLIHRPSLKAGREKGKRMCAYAYCWLKGADRPVIVALSLGEIERRRARGQGDTPAWRDDYDAMSRKTAMRELAKWIPQCRDMTRASSIEDSQELEDYSPGDVIDITEPARRGRAAEVAEKLSGQAAGTKRQGAPAQSARQPEEDEDDDRPISADDIADNVPDDGEDDDVEVV